MLEITLSNGKPLVFKKVDARKFRGTRLPGAELSQAVVTDLSLSIHDYSQKLFRFSLRNISSQRTQTIHWRDSSHYLRLETLVTGSMEFREEDGSAIRILPGQYRITNSSKYQVSLAKNEGCDLFVAYISPELLTQTPLSEYVVPCDIQMMSIPMREVIYRILDNPFEEKFRNAFYDYSIRELLFYHISAPPVTPPGKLTPVEQAAVFEADRIILADLSVHYTINELSRMTRTNAHVLKTGFASIFGMGAFERLLQKKMEMAKYLLETTDKQIQTIAQLAGYETVTGFINAFRKQFKMTPKDWRKKQRGLL